MAAVLQPADLKERRGRWLQRARRTTIALCWVWLLAIPLWHMARGARWTESPALPSPPLWGR